MSKWTMGNLPRCNLLYIRLCEITPNVLQSRASFHNSLACLVRSNLAVESLQLHRLKRVTHLNSRPCGLIHPFFRAISAEMKLPARLDGLQPVSTNRGNLTP